jgi:radical SAM enzyme (TIGR01210 family)
VKRAVPEPYPTSAAARDRFVLARRPPRPPHDPWQHQGLIIEDEPAEGGGAARVATVLLTGRECPWRCAMCDLWRYTTEEDTPRGAIPAQVVAARTALRAPQAPVTVMKLYNAGSFFDPRAVPDDDYDAIAAALGGLTRVIVESHPSLVGTRVDRLIDALDRHRGGESPARLEVAMGLETAHPAALDRLNKRFTFQGFARAARSLAERRVSLRVFLLVSPPFVPCDEQDDWLLRSVEAALSCGASAISLVPTRAGNGTVEVLPRHEFVPPTLSDVERSLSLALTHARGRGRVFADVWDLEPLARCSECFAARAGRLKAMNLAQQLLPPVACSSCAAGPH